ncbi:diguanylate cyclase (GGDEF)-like protein [Rhodococcus sp. 27YEA15]|uniref:putative bifunctional diguanylate cyclase/phosphodiesterase n=1 Tax=Rhodococcus sp. 27YEA15 TaxID=3156259 RepID=UPI003C7C5ACA
MASERRPPGVSNQYALTRNQRSEVAHEQVRVTLGLLPWAATLHLVTVAGLLFFLIPPDAGLYGKLWPWIAGSIGGIGLVVGIRIRRGTMAFSHVVGHAFLMVAFVVVGLLYSSLAIVLYPRLDHAGDLVLSVVLAVIMAAGALGTAMLRSLGTTWVLSNIVFLGVAFWQQGTPELSKLMIAMIAYGSALVVGAVVVSGNFEARYRAEVGAESERAMSRILLDDLHGNAGDFVWEIDMNGTLSRIPTKLAVEVGTDPDRGVGAQWQDLFLELGTHKIAGGIDALMQLRAARQSKSAFFDVVIPARLRGEIRWWQLSGRPTEGIGPSDLVWRGVATDITDAKIQSDRMIRMGKIDALTGMPNRHSFWTELERLLRTAPAGPNRIALAMLDLDDFKSVNDTLGHTIGDDVLREVASRLSDVGGMAQLCARLGGDEFAILFTDVDDEAQVLRILERYVDALHEPIAVFGTRLEIGCSIGYFVPTERSATADELTTAADLALFAAKSSGRGTMRRYSDDLRAIAARRAHLLENVGAAIAARKFDVTYLPQVSTRGEHVVAAEIKLVWNDPELGPIEQPEFTRAAEDAGLTGSLGEMTVDLACHAAAQLPSDVRVAFAVTARQLDSTSYIAAVDSALRRWGVAAQRLELELTESSAIEQNVPASIRDVAQLGVVLTVDEFGIGFSALATLSELPFARVRIDRSFAGAIGDSEPGTPILEAIVDLVGALGMQSIVLGVDSDEQLDSARRAGADAVQGNIATGGPLTLGELKEHLAGTRG